MIPNIRELYQQRSREHYQDYTQLFEDVSSHRSKMNPQCPVSFSVPEQRLPHDGPAPASLLRRLHEFVDGLNWYSDEVRSTDDGKFYIRAEMMPGTDLHREALAPGAGPYPDGALGVRAYENFWIMAIVPLIFLDLPFYDLVSVLWPGAEQTALLYPEITETSWEDNEEEALSG